MFSADDDREPDEYTRLAYLLAINDRVLSDFTENYDSGTDAPAQKVIESRLLAGDDALVPQSALAEYRAAIVQYGNKIRADLQQFKRVKVNTYAFAANEQAEEKRPTKRRRAAEKDPTDG